MCKARTIYFSSIKIINYKSKVDLVCVKNRSSLAEHSTEICRPLLSPQHLLDPQALLPGQQHCLEIGFGNGETLLTQAKHNPRRGEAARHANHSRLARFSGLDLGIFRGPGSRTATGKSVQISNREDIKA